MNIMQVRNEKQTFLMIFAFLSLAAVFYPPYRLGDEYEKAVSELCRLSDRPNTVYCRQYEAAAKHIPLVRHDWFWKADRYYLAEINEMVDRSVDWSRLALTLLAVALLSLVASTLFVRSSELKST